MNRSRHWQTAFNGALRDPILLTPGAAPVPRTASIGIACGRYATPDNLLRDATSRSIRRRRTGKDRHVLFSASAEPELVAKST